MSAPWFEIDPDRDRMPDPIADRYRLRDPWGDYCQPGDVIPITFAGTNRYGRAVVTGCDADGCAVVLPLDPELSVVGCDIGANFIPGNVTPLPTRGSAPFSTGDEAS